MRDVLSKRLKCIWYLFSGFGLAERVCLELRFITNCINNGPVCLVIRSFSRQLAHAIFTPAVRDQEHAMYICRVFIVFSSFNH